MTTQNNPTGYWSKVIKELKDNKQFYSPPKDDAIPDYFEITSDPLMRGYYPHNFNGSEMAMVLTIGNTYSANIPASLRAQLFASTAPTNKMFQHENSIAYHLKCLWHYNFTIPTCKTYVDTNSKLLSFGTGLLSILKSSIKTVEYLGRLAISPLTNFHRYSVGIALKPSDYLSHDDQGQEITGAQDLFNKSDAPVVKAIKNTQKIFPNASRTMGILLQILNIPLNLMIKKPIDTVGHFINYSMNFATELYNLNNCVDKKEKAYRIKRAKFYFSGLLPTLIVATPLVVAGFLSPTFASEVSQVFTAAGSGSFIGIAITLAGILAVGVFSWLTQIAGSKMSKKSIGKNNYFANNDRQLNEENNEIPEEKNSKEHEQLKTFVKKVEELVNNNPAIKNNQTIRSQLNECNKVLSGRKPEENLDETTRISQLTIKLVEFGAQQQTDGTWFINKNIVDTHVLKQEITDLKKQAAKLLGTDSKLEPSKKNSLKDAQSKCATQLALVEELIRSNKQAQAKDEKGASKLSDSEGGPDLLTPLALSTLTTTTDVDTTPRQAKPSIEEQLSAAVAQLRTDVEAFNKEIEHANSIKEDKEKPVPVATQTGTAQPKVYPSQAGIFSGSGAGALATENETTMIMPPEEGTPLLSTSTSKK